jgi:predicted AlkP superfamily phosphohydrolase/phosphomutase
MMETKPRRIMIIGFDGATLDLIRPWAEAGLLPTFRRLMQEGAWGPLRTITPPITPTAWTSFATGMNPGKHGLYDFTGRKSGSYETYLINSSHRKAAPLWQLLSEQGKQVIVLNVPVTYPPDPVNGLMVSGLLTPASAKDATWPPELQKKLQEAVPDFNFSPPGMYSRGQDAEFVQAVRALIQTTLKATRYLMEQQPWDCLISIFMSTDIMSHFMWKHMETEGSLAPEPVRDVVKNALRDCYRDADAALAELLEAAGPETAVIIMSDHGFGPMDSYMSVNAWLIERGYIQFKRSLPSQLRYRLYRTGFTPLSIYGLLLRLGLGERMRTTSRKNIGLVARIIQGLFPTFRDVDWSRTTAYSNGYAGPIFINLEGREPQGIVAPGAEYDALLDRVIADLQQLKEPGTDLPFVGEIHRGRVLYSGANTDRAPDLIFMPRNPRYAGLGLVEFPSNRWLTSSPDRSGFHRMDGILFLAGPGVRPGVELQGSSIMDIAPTVLALLDTPIPQAMDGHVLENALTDQLCRQLDITFRQSEARPAGPRPDGGPEISAEDEDLIRTRLRDLGYVA